MPLSSPVTGHAIGTGCVAFDDGIHLLRLCESVERAIQQVLIAEAPAAADENSHHGSRGLMPRATAARMAPAKSANAATRPRM